MTIEAAARRRWTKIVVDSALLVGFIAEFVTREGPDYAIHSWIGIMLVPVIVVHLIGNASWIRRVLEAGRQDREFSLGVLNAILGTLAVVCIATGFPLWLDWFASGALEGVHAFSGFMSIALMLVHLWRNRVRLRRLLR